MTLRIYSISLFILFFSNNLFSQKPVLKKSKIELVNGEIIEAELSVLAVEGTSGKDKIRVCKEKNEKCEKYSIGEIAKITLMPSESLIESYKKAINENPEMIYDEEEIIRHYKVLYSPKKGIPRMCEYVYFGENIEFYNFKISTLKSQIFIAEVNKKTIIHHYAKKNTKNQIKELTNFFKDCNELIKESEQKSAHKNHEIEHFYKIADKCGI